MVKDGQTIVIGGLFRNKITKSKSQVPLLGSLPLVGTLFRGVSDSVDREEVIVLLTPHILDEPDHQAGMMAKTDVDRKMVGAKDELMRIDSVKITEDSYANAAAAYIEGDKEEAMRSVQIALAVQPTHLQAIRLKERILSECSPDEYRNLERIILEKVASKTAVCDVVE